MVSFITEEGYLKFVPLEAGGTRSFWVPGIVRTDNGDVPGVIGSKPPHILAGSEQSSREKGYVH